MYHRIPASNGVVTIKVPTTVGSGDRASGVEQSLFAASLRSFLFRSLVRKDRLSVFFLAIAWFNMLQIVERVCEEHDC